jgi:Ca2+/Na+ antiporter
VGEVIGGIAFLLAIILTVVCIVRRRRRGGVQGNQEETTKVDESLNMSNKAEISQVATLSMPNVSHVSQAWQPTNTTMPVSTCY